MGSFYDRMRSNLGYDVAVEPVPEPGLLQQWQTDFGEATRLSTQQRIAGFGACVVFTTVFWALVRACRYAVGRCQLSVCQSRALRRPRSDTAPTLAGVILVASGPTVRARQ